MDFSASLPTVLKKVADKMARNMMFRVDLCTELTQLVEVASTLPSHVTSASRHSFPASLCQSVGVASAGAGAGAGSGAGTAAALKDPPRRRGTLAALRPGASGYRRGDRLI